MLDRAGAEDYQTLRDFRHVPLKDLLSEATLHNVGLGGECGPPGDASDADAPLKRKGEPAGGERKAARTSGWVPAVAVKRPVRSGPVRGPDRRSATPAAEKEKRRGEEGAGRGKGETAAPARERRKLVIQEEEEEEEEEEIIRDEEAAGAPAKGQRKERAAVRGKVKAAAPVTDCEAEPIYPMGAGASGPPGPGISAKASVARDPLVAHRLFGGLVLPEDTRRLFSKDPRDIRKGAVECFLELGVYLNGYIERWRDATVVGDKHESELNALRPASEALRESWREALLKRSEAEAALQKEAAESVRLRGALDIQLETEKQLREELARLRAEKDALATSEGQLRHEVGRLTVARDAQVAKAATFKAAGEDTIRDLKAALETSGRELVEAAATAAERAATAAAEAVRQFKESEDFLDAQADFAMEAFFEGIARAKKAVAQRLPETDLEYLNDIQFEEDGEEGDGGAGAVPAEPSVGSRPAPG